MSMSINKGAPRIQNNQLVQQVDIETRTPNPNDPNIVDVEKTSHEVNLGQAGAGVDPQQLDALVQEQVGAVGAQQVNQTKSPAGEVYNDYMSDHFEVHANQASTQLNGSEVVSATANLELSAERSTVNDLIIQKAKEGS